MVDKKKGVINKNEFLAVSLVLIAICFMVFVFAGHTVKTSSGGDSYNLNEDVGFIYNITINNTDTGDNSNITAVNITLDALFLFVPGEANGTDAPVTTFSNTSNVLSWINASGLIMSNTNNSFWFNATVSTYGSYEINVTTYNLTGSYSTLLTVTVNETSTAPEVSTVYPVSYGNYSDSININVSINDSDSYGLIDTVIFMLTNSSAGQNSSMNYTASQQGLGLYWNATIDTTGFADGTYNITVWANDTSGNLNNSAVVYSIVFDNTHPAPSSLVKSSSTKTSLTITFSGADGTCTATGTGTRVISGSTLTVTGLSCNNPYTYTITCVDAAGNSGSSTLSTPFTTSSCGGGGSASSGYTWKNTYVTTKEQFKAGYTREIKVQNRIKVQVGNSYHYVGVKELTATTATIEIASEPVEVKLNIGEDAKIDVDADDVYDIYVKLLGIANNQANVFVQEISEEVPEGEGTVSTTGEDLTTVEDEETTIPDKEKDLTWLWVLIGILILVSVIGGGIVVKNRKK